MPRSLSPLSVPYRVLQRGGGLAVALAFLLGGGVNLPFLGPAGPLALLFVAGVAALALVGYETAYVRRFEYELTADTLDIDSGVLSRRSREIPIRRIQNVDISRNVIQRLLGIAVVSFETAGGGETEAQLRYVTFEEAKRLQRELARLKRGASADAEGEDAERAAVEPESTELFALDRSELAILGALSVDLRVPGILFLLVSTVGSTVISTYLSSIPGVALVVVAGALLLAVAVVSWVVGAAAAIVEYYDFRLVRSGDELQYERGLLQRYDGSIPFDKIQTLTVADNPLKRHFGYATLYIETAGYTPGSSTGSRGSEAAIPLAEREHVLELVEELEPVGEVDFERPPRRARRRYLVRYFLVVGVLTGILAAARSLLSLPVPWWPPLLLVPLAALFAHLTWRHRGHWLGDHHVVTRNGVLRRETKIVPYYRIQTVIDSRSVFQRRLGLATVTVDTAGSLSLGGQDAAAVDVSDATADRLRDELESRLGQAVDAYRAGRAGIGFEDEYARSGAASGGDGDSSAGGADGDDDPAGHADSDGDSAGHTDDDPAGGADGDANDARTPRSDGDADAP
ncbi:PH domain-containing protein [Halobellus litoreus]|uniref:PH domain-containing protein n=1 Tax=Halobellus litoreus TaxID=755310 RepID=A0ABD6DXA4_9EURY|nr:PH domain-containing protein [Halobellus litoreus]